MEYVQFAYWVQYVTRFYQFKMRFGYLLILLTHSI